MRATLLVSSIILAILLVPELPAYSSSGKTQADVAVRHYSFSSQYPTGVLRMLASTDDLGGASSGEVVGKAQGKMDVKVPSGQSIQLDVNPHCIEAPERLKNIPGAGIERLRVSYVSMDEGVSVCDSALKALPKFKDLFGLSIDRSDTTDEGLAAFQSLSQVKYLYALCACISGSIFKDSMKLQSLEKIDLSGNYVKGQNLRYLNRLPRLSDLILNQTNFSDDDLLCLPYCPNLVAIHLMDDGKITGRSLQAIRQQKNLRVLNLRNTGVTIDDLLTLKNLKLKRLWVTVKRYRKEDLSRLEAAFPGAIIEFRGRGVPEEAKSIYAPLK